jgi:hypothetical protein
MTPELEKCLVELTQSILNAADKIKASAEYQVPDYIHQLLVWHSVKSLIMFAVAMMFIAIAVKSAKKAWDLLKEGKNRLDGLEDLEDRTIEDGECVAKIMFSCIVTVVFFCLGMYCSNITWLNIWLAPKVWLVEYATTLLK